MVVLNYYNYKHSHFTDHRRNYECLYADTGTNCRVNNGGGGERGGRGVYGVKVKYQLELKIIK